jgi:type VI secretion system secreted protein VgrG
MAESAQSGFQLVHTSIKVEGTEGAIIYSNLIVNQYLADVNSFSFNWRQEEKHASLNDHVSFYQKNLSKEVTINIHQNLTFKGIIYSINCSNQDFLGVEYEISGKGHFIKLDEVPVCNSFFKKDLAAIFNTLNKTKGTSLKAEPTTGELFYTVQYNQTTFQFYRMMAARQGEWLYYTGTDMILGKPGTEKIDLKLHEDVYDVNISARMGKAPNKQGAFNNYVGEKLENKESVKTGSGFIEAGLIAGDNAYGKDESITHISHAVTKNLLKGIAELQQKAAIASTVFITGRTYNSKIKLANKIKLKDDKGAVGEYIITELHHTCIAPDSYQNQFVAIPAEAEVPPYTNPHLFPLCKPQPANITHNEDKDGLDRVKVHFPWQQSNETTPWINVITPHAGKDKGIRFIPEVGDEVLVGFVDNNAERPYMMGALHTETNKSGNDHVKNNLKVIGTKTGRRIEIDDEKGEQSFSDNYTKEKTKNLIFQKRKDGETMMKIGSYKGDKAYSNIEFTNEESLMITLSTGSAITEIKMEKGGEKITIKAKGNIDITSDKDITMKGQNITIEAQQKLNMKGTSGVEIKGMKIAATADTTMEVKGMTTTVEGSAKADFKGGAMASLSAALVKIN